MIASHRQAKGLARGLGWFSIGLGVAELLAARSLARAVGLRGHEGLLRAYGVREIVTGIGLLAAGDGGKQAPWLWGRVGGDMLDMATLAPGLQTRHRTGAAVALAAVAGVTALDVVCARSLSSQPAAPVDYSDRSGYPRPVEEMRGAALADFEAPRDMRIPAALRPWVDGRPAELAAQSA